MNDPTPPAPSRGVYIFVIGFFAVMLIVALGMTTIGVQQLFVQKERLTTWPAVTGTITSVDVNSNTTRSPGTRRSGSTTTTAYRPMLGHTYTVAGVEHESSQALPMSGTDGKSEWAWSLVRPYSVGDEVAVYYNPADPAESFVIRYWDDKLLLIAAFAGFVPLFLAVVLTAGAKPRYATKWMMTAAASAVFALSLLLAAGSYFVVVPMADQTLRARVVFAVAAGIVLAGMLVSWLWRRAWLATAG